MGHRDSLSENRGAPFATVKSLIKIEIILENMDTAVDRDRLID